MPDNPIQRYCTNCGVQLKPGSNFCVACGSSLSRGNEAAIKPMDFGVERTHADSSGEEVGGADSSTNTSAAHLATSVRDRFKQLPLLAKVCMIVVLALVLFVFLERVVIFLTLVATVFFASMLGLKSLRRESIKVWSVAARTSLALFLICGSISIAGGGGVLTALFSGGGSAGNENGSGDTPSGVQYDMKDSPPDTSYELVYVEESDSSYQIASTPGLNVLQVFVTADARSRAELEAVAETVIADYTEPDYDAVELTVALSWRDEDPWSQTPAITATVAKSDFGESVSGIAKSTYTTDFAFTDAELDDMYRSQASE